MTTSAVHTVYLPANGAYMVMWHDSRLAGPMPLDEAKAYVRWLDGVTAVLS